jgi:hypothetical protein
MAVQMNVGILLGIVIAPIERRDLFDLFAADLKAHGFSRDELQAAPLLNERGRALKAYAFNSHERHFRCCHHILESLGSRTLGAVLARQLLLTKTRAADDELLPQTLSDLAAGYHVDSIIRRGKQQFC